MDGQDEVEPLGWQVYVGVGVLWIASFQALSWAGIQTEGAYLLVAAAFFLLLGGACWLNGRRCGAIHCRLSGPAYVLLSVLAVLASRGVLSIEVGTLMWAFLGVMIGSYGIELWMTGRGRTAA